MKIIKKKLALENERRKCPICGRSLNGRILIMIDENGKEEPGFCISAEIWNDLNLLCEKRGIDVADLINIMMQAFLDRFPQRHDRETREEALHDKAETRFLGFIKINSSIEGGRFPHGLEGFYSGMLQPLNALCVWCGNCGLQYVPAAVRLRIFTLMFELNHFFDGKLAHVQPMEMNQKFRCIKCGNNLHLKATITPEIPKTRKELLAAYEQFAKVFKPNSIT